MFINPVVICKIIVYNEDLRFHLAGKLKEFSRSQYMMIGIIIIKENIKRNIDYASK